MKKKWLLISDQEMTELQIDLGNENRETINLRCNFSSSDHNSSPSGMRREISARPPAAVLDKMLV
jgi:hypothetical protein